jgi:HD superfamily phosphohydrolase YqeK
MWRRNIAPEIPFVSMDGIQEMGRSFDLMPIEERARCYREMAAAACNLAEKAPSLDSKADYLQLAAAWHDMAVELESEMQGRTSLKERHRFTG